MNAGRQEQRNFWREVKRRRRLHGFKVWFLRQAGKEKAPSPGKG